MAAGTDGVAHLLGHLRHPDIEWLLTAGAIVQVPRGAEFPPQGEPVHAFHLIHHGVLTGASALENGRPLRLGPGGLLGGVQFLNGSLPNDRLQAAEDCSVLRIPFAAVREQCERHPDFGYRLYRTLGETAAAHAADLIRRAPRGIPGQADASSGGGLEAVREVIIAFERTMHRVDRIARKEPYEIPADLEDVLYGRFLEMCFVLESTIRAIDEVGEAREEIGAYAREQLLPYLLLSSTGERFYSKPRGYAGDYLTIAGLYDNHPAGQGPIGLAFDRCLLRAPLPQAVRNRRNILSEEIARTVADRAGAPSNVTSLACGPAAEIFDAYEALADASMMKTTLLDLDLQALAYVADRCEKRGLRKQMRFVNDNLIHLALGRSNTPITDQDLVYSIGLIDYFNDDLVVKLLNAIYNMLRPGGRAILGNFHTSNPGKAFMDDVLDWRLVHRSEEDMNRLFRASAFGRPCTGLRFEPERINLFAECVRD